MSKSFLALAVGEQAPRARILTALAAMLPRVGVADDGAFVCDLRGTERLLGAPARVARNAIAACGASGGVTPAAGIGATPFVARVAAARAPAGSVCEIPAGGERAFLDGLSLAALRLRLVLEREDALPLRLERSLLPPSGESAAIVRSLRWGLEEIATLGAVTSAALEVGAVEPARGRQIGLFAPDGAHAEEAIAVAQFLRT